MTDFWDKVLKFSETTAAQVGKQLLGDFGHVQASQKDDGTLVTQSDRWADREIREAIAEAFPDHGVLTEEGDRTFPDTEWCWAIDPLDGTTNFSRGIPIWGVSLGLLYRGTPVFGYVELPPLSQSFHGFWYGDTGLSGPEGAFLNKKPIHPSSDPLSKNHFFSLCSRSVGLAPKLSPCKIRMLGVATYNLLSVATGIAIGGIEATPKIWDIAATWAIVQAAGAIWIPLESEQIFPLQADRDYTDRPFPTLAVARPELISHFDAVAREIGR